jgi:4-hydroxybenzoyl-CoA thioesterase
MSFTNSRSVRIEWGDCDPAGIIFYPRYFNIFDASTAALFERALGMTMIRYLKALDFAGHPLLRTRARFVRPTRYGDDVTVDSAIAFGDSSFDIEHRLSLDSVTCVECSETRVWMARDPANPGGYKPVRVPDAVRAKFGLSPSS